MKKTLFLLLTLGIATSALAWGGREHRLIAHIAEGHLTPRTRQVLDRYLDQSIVEYSTWMDRYRTAPGYEMTTNWHMMTIDEHGNAPLKPIRPSGNGDAVGQLARAIEQLQNYRNLTDSAVCLNLKLVIHILEDMHCPSHIYFSDVPGGILAKPHYGFFQLKYKGAAINYHGIWDSSISRMHPTWLEDDYRKAFDTWTPEQQREVCKGGPVDWGRDNGQRCRQIYDWAKPGDNLDESFYQKYGWLPEEQARRSAYRMAHVLNQLFDK